MNRFGTGKKPCNRCVSNIRSQRQIGFARSMFIRLLKKKATLVSSKAALKALQNPWLLIIRFICIHLCSICISEHHPQLARQQGHKHFV